MDGYCWKKKSKYIILNAVIQEKRRINFSNSFVVKYKWLFLLPIETSGAIK